MKSSIVEVEELKSPEDFSSLLNIQELKKQQAIFDNLNENLFKYKKRFFESFLVKWDEIDSHLSEDDNKLFLDKLNKSDIESPLYHRRGPYNSFIDYHKKTFGDRSNSHVYILDFKNKEIYLINKYYHTQEIDFKFDDNIFQVILKDVLTNTFNYNSPYADEYQTISFNANDNTFLSYEMKTIKYQKGY